MSIACCREKAVLVTIYVEKPDEVTIIGKWATNSKAPPTSEVLPAKRKPKRATSPSCLGKWDSLIPSFFKTTMNPKGKKKSSVFTITTKMEAPVKCLQVQKKGIFMSK
ncbi:uncharacterized protein LOC142544561 [Primulina tabacum]|uniref:uncharacterized protein LOC142544561 n=1 Tax=Primulina tabacum TaxID=48773 RepID=UPI003F59C4D8